ncbi:MAG: hypothetical protein PHS09_02835 [Candidatus Omnitrophica bacterium]|nr:hypothetical protein [Candidatus Omnitrophota bacterium]MDD5512873.1 hypothetical protein [Candidatus Omnitrophota bacterium]
MNKTYRQGFFWAMLLILGLTYCGQAAYAAEDKFSAGLSKKIIGQKEAQAILSSLEEARDGFFKDHEYSAFVDFLNSLGRKKKSLRPYVNYYTALTRHSQLAYLESIQDWNEYFSKGDEYRHQMQSSLLAGLKEVNPEDPLYLSLKLLQWKYAQEQQDPAAQGYLTELIGACEKYSKESKDFSLIKDLGDQVLAAGQKNSAKKIYAVFAQALTKTTDSPGELERSAADFYNQKNMDLAQLLYDAYIEKLLSGKDKAKAVTALQEIAQKFTYRDQEPNDPAYAEKIFAELESLGGEGVFNEKLIYLRAYNLEKLHEFEKAALAYQALIKNFANSERVPEAKFKAGVINAYIMRQVDEGKKYFNELFQQGDLSSWGAAAGYQLGLLSQFSAEADQAAVFYRSLIDRAKENFQDTVMLARQRLQEIDGKNDLEYNLKTFLETALDKGPAEGAFNASKINLQCSPCLAEKNSSVKMSSEVSVPASGCTQIELRYLWSGDLGENPPLNSDPSFTTAYRSSGSKVINLVVVNPAGVIDYGLDFVDID